MESLLDVNKMNRLIKRKYKTQSAFARKLGVSRQYVSYLMKTGKTPSLERTIVLADALGVTVNDLLGKSATPQARSALERSHKEREAAREARPAQMALVES